MKDKKFRLATRKDWDEILRLRNCSFEFFKDQKKPLTKKEHYKYMDEQTKNTNFYHYFYEEKVYVVLKNGHVSVITKPEFRNHGFGVLALVELCKLHQNFTATINIKNTASFKMCYEASKIFINSNL
jgi:hypothetical protein